MTSIARIIEKKRDGEVLTTAELDFYIRGVVEETIQTSQIGAMLMAIYLNGMNTPELADLTRAMINTRSQIFEWPDEWKHLVVDKHSTGGVGDKVSLTLVPALAACGLKVPMISGRGLGLTGGTLDKLESIPGFNVSQNVQDIYDIVDRVGCCIVGQTRNLVPADKITYSIRDVTGTVASYPLIAASILSKKASESLSSLIMDIKVGRGALFCDIHEARKFAKIMVELSTSLNIKMIAKLSRMDSVLGRTVGHSLEILEALRCLRGPASLMGESADKDSCRVLRNITIELGAELLIKTGVEGDLCNAKQRLREVMCNGEALHCFRRLMIAQGVDDVTADTLIKDESSARDVMPTSQYRVPLIAHRTGYVRVVNADIAATMVAALGGSRVTTDCDIDLSVGLSLHVDVGDHVTTGSEYGVIHHNGNGLELVQQLQSQLLVLSKTPIEKHIIDSLVLDTVS